MYLSKEEPVTRRSALTADPRTCPVPGSVAASPTPKASVLLQAKQQQPKAKTHDDKVRADLKHLEEAPQHVLD